ncbi:amino acid ABC transporter permease [Candidatus Galacturonibacter soehngenii]|uniref:Amino acid ABC transporter permease n=1 Tax=Candidatus Galacturonatibacter soehngenii TaxID=2307010 RepID=A0A7V7QH53_9FIRM|nr:amino acid ABC transporter permease [Candidatus Galacturonibacter soehngenii]KAB1434235.1 amino acid ABC transporter permease [Candidatus Galacturonibacter soehngenii]MBA4686169.1 amino acid ABC transporter permease [Candidatus Galacturonibacter soehngenii]
MDIQFISKYLPLYVEAAKLTLTIATIGIISSIFVGFCCSLVRYYKIPFIHKIVSIYIELSRNTPLLIQLFFLYFGLPKIGIRLSSESCAIVGLTFLGGSYMAEAFRSGLEAIPKIQRESGLSIGLTKFQVFWHIILPQAVTISMPAFSANVVFLIKETSVFSAVALADLMYVAKDLIGLYYKTDEALFMLVCAYLIILLPISIIFSIIERKLRYAGFGN